MGNFCASAEGEKRITLVLTSKKEPIADGNLSEMQHYEKLVITISSYINSTSTILKKESLRQSFPKLSLQMMQ